MPLSTYDSPILNSLQARRLVFISVAVLESNRYIQAIPCAHNLKGKESAVANCFQRHPLQRHSHCPVQVMVSETEGVTWVFAI